MKPTQRISQKLALAGVLAVTSLAAKGAQDPEPLPPAQILQRLSLKLKGVVPTAAETANFTAALQAHPDQFAAIYGAVVDSYMAAPEFRRMVQQLHSIWWGLQPGESTSLAGYIVANDHPYSELFVKDYVFLDGSLAPAYSQTGIATAEPLPSEPGDWRAVRLAPAETRFRSMLSNFDFLNTYPDTPTNKNRKRAKEIFHIFLCETLAPTDPQDHPTPPALLAAAPVDSGSPVDPPDPHGTDPNCVGCHYRLDPLARFFDHWRPPFANSTTAWFDPTQAAAGMLILPLPDGTHSKVPGVAESDLGKILLAEPRVTQCTVSTAWRFLLGQGVQLSAADGAALVQALTARQNYKDLIKKVVMHPYFWSTEEPPPLKFADMRSAFQVCTQCHSQGGGLDPAFDPGTYPFLPDPAANEALLVRIWGAINHSPGYLPMPEPPAPNVPAQPLPADTLAQLREWISAGAYTDGGQSTLTDAQIEEVLNDN
jgi:mono/diheme cytochrome c family protein